MTGKFLRLARKRIIGIQKTTSKPSAQHQIVYRAGKSKNSQVCFVQFGTHLARCNITVHCYQLSFIGQPRPLIFDLQACPTLVVSYYTRCSTPVWCHRSFVHASESCTLRYKNILDNQEQLQLLDSPWQKWPRRHLKHSLPHLISSNFSVSSH